jgi:hypothetical protein
LKTDGSIPEDNPDPSSYVYSYGHRNVQGIYLAPNGLIYLSEHGASSDDEFQLLEPGRNYGWPSVEGFCDLTGEQTFCVSNNVKEPLAVWTPTIAPSDLTWYENPNFPEFNGKLLLTVLKDKKIIAIELSSDGTQYISESHYLTNQFGRLRDICIGPNKEIYLATNGSSWSNTNPNTHSIIRLMVSNSAAINEKEDAKIRIYPNPSGDFLQVKIDETFKGATAKIMDFSGKLISTFQISELNFLYPISDLTKGVYYLTLEKNEIILSSTRFIK